MMPLQRIVDSLAFTATVVAVILANAFVLGLQTYPSINREYGDALNLLNNLFLAFFVVEIGIGSRPTGGGSGGSSSTAGTSSTSSRPLSPSGRGCVRTRPSFALRGLHGSSGSATCCPTSASSSPPSSAACRRSRAWRSSRR
jgi:hypothetical protein